MGPSAHWVRLLGWLWLMATPLVPGGLGILLAAGHDLP